MSNPGSLQIGASAEPDAEAAAAALAEAAAKAPTSTEEAAQQIADAKAAEAAAKEGEGTSERPAWLPEKFASAEDLAKAYAELEAKQSGKTGAEATADTTADTDEKTEGEKPAETPDVTKVDIAAINAEFAEKGELPAERYEQLEKLGFDKATVDSYIAGQQALADAATARITEAAGGKDSMERMFAWASTALKAEEIDTFNASFENADVNAAVIAMEQLKSKYVAANGSDPKLITGKGGVATSDTFKSWAEVTAAMGDPRYRTDPAYQAKVASKLGRSKL